MASKGLDDAPVTLDFGAPVAPLSIGLKVENVVELFMEDG